MSTSEAKLIVNGREYVLAAETTRVGRDTDNDIVLDHLNISTHHAEISHRNGQIVVRDLGSTNGTRVNGIPVIEAYLNDGDVVEFGSIQCALARVTGPLSPTLVLGNSAGGRSNLRFRAWPQNRSAATLTVLLISFVFIFATASGGLAAGILASGMMFSIITATRFAWHRLTKPKPTPNQSRRPIPLWRHPATIGLAAACVIALLVAAAMSSSTNSSRQDLYEAAARHQRAWNDHNSTERVAGEMLTQVEHGLALDFKGATKRSEAYQDKTDQLTAEHENLQHWQYTLNKKQRESDAMIGLVIAILVLLFMTITAYFLLRFAWRRHKIKRALKGRSSPPPLPLAALKNG